MTPAYYKGIALGLYATGTQAQAATRGAEALALHLLNITPKTSPKAAPATKQASGFDLYSIKPKTKPAKVPAAAKLEVGITKEVNGYRVKMRGINYLAPTLATARAAKTHHLEGK